MHLILKCDQAKEGLVNNTSQMDEYCRDKGFLSWFETSAKENINIDEAARALVSKVGLLHFLSHINGSLHMVDPSHDTWERSSEFRNRPSVIVVKES